MIGFRLNHFNLYSDRFARLAADVAVGGGGSLGFLGTGEIYSEEQFRINSST